MSKRFKYLVSSLAATAGFILLISLPYESHIYGLITGIVLTIFCFWFGLGIIFDKSILIRLMTIILPVGFFVGFGLFMALFPFNLLAVVVSCLIFGVVIYVLFLIENVFLVALNYKTVPLYRSAYTVGVIILMLTSFLLFNSLFSFRWLYWVNGLGVWLISWLLLTYHYWSVEIELVPSKTRSMVKYTVLPGFLVGQLGLIFSFWPVGIFKASLYLVLVIYVLCGLLQTELRERLFKRTWMINLWVGIAIILGILLITRWDDF